MEKLTNIKKYLILNLLAGFVLGIVFPLRVLAIGQMTKPIVFDTAMRGQELTEKLILFSSQEGDVTYGLSGGGDIGEWVSFYAVGDADLNNPITEVTVPSRSQAEAIVKFKVPQDAPNGTYSGEVAVTGSAVAGQNEDQNMVQVMDRVGRKVAITITDKEIINVLASVIPLQYGISNSQPLKIKMIFDNQGNVAVKPEVSLKITEVATNTTVHNATYPYPESESAVKPFERKSIENFIVWQPSNLPLGKYNATAKIILNGDMIQEESFNFDILTVAQANDLSANASSAVSFPGQMAGAYVLGIVLVMGGVMAAASRFAKKTNI